VDEGIVEAAAAAAAAAQQQQQQQQQAFVDAYVDRTFMTAVGIVQEDEEEEEQGEDHGPGGAGAGAAPGPPLRAAWRDVEDPTERLALSLGLDPCLLPLHTRALTGDSLAACNALRFALAHPLVEVQAGACVGRRPAGPPARLPA
jgi:hypothetical protein